MCILAYVLFYNLFNKLTDELLKTFFELMNDELFKRIGNNYIEKKTVVFINIIYTYIIYILIFL